MIALYGATPTYLLPTTRVLSTLIYLLYVAFMFLI